MEIQFDGKVRLGVVDMVQCFRERFKEVKWQ